MTPPVPSIRPTPIEDLRSRFSLQLPNADKSRREAEAVRARIRDRLQDLDFSETTSLTVFGSLARNEWTSGSDVDWTLLIDGPADPEHFRLATEISRRFQELNLRAPGATATFGTLTSSHELVHLIGGDDDTNRNMTRRVLLLLESCSLAGDLVRERVMRSVLNRYIVCGPGVPEQANPKLRVPRFLLNDVVRLWRTFAVDYAAKKWQRSDEGWAIRNAKLRVPRKLTFAKGLLLCLDCEFLAGEWPWNTTGGEPAALATDTLEPRLVNGCFDLAQMTPLNMLARALLRLGSKEAAEIILRAYDDYLCLIDDPVKREHLEKRVSFETALQDTTFSEVREISHRFGDALEKLFFEEQTELATLTKKYGLF